MDANYRPADLVSAIMYDLKTVIRGAEEKAETQQETR
jgi:hypothetical protein